MTHDKIIPLLLVGGALGCTIPPGAVTVTSAPAQVVPAGPDYVEVAQPGFDVFMTPQIVYDGRPTYLYNDRWYYQGDNGRWRYYRSEPSPLLEHRRNYQFNHERGYLQRGREFDPQYRRRQAPPNPHPWNRDYDRNDRNRPWQR